MPGKRILLVVLLFLALPASAKPFPVEEVPPLLSPWVPWVLDEVPDRACATDQGGAAVCVFPSVLILDLADEKGTFQLDVRLDREALVELPGDAARWPQAVVAGETPSPVFDRENRPSLLLGPGEHRIRGTFFYKSIPESIPVPKPVGRVELTVMGKPVPFPRRDEDGLLWVQPRADRPEDGERLDIEVSRKISDGIPMTVVTRIVLRASGRAREVDLGKVLLDGTVPMRIDGDVPARFDASGALHAQVRAGTFNLEITARTDGTAPETLRFPKQPAPWPSEETWVWEANDSLRQVTLTGAVGVDPSRTGVKEDWRKLPAYLVSADNGLTLRTERRGEPEPPPARLELEREIWMDPDGNGYTLRDTLIGTLTRTWRLDLAPPAMLGHVAVDGQDQLVTTNSRTGQAGVELRKGAVALVAESRIDDATRTLPAVGWSEDVQKLSAVLHLAPGWRLFSASGVDRLPGTWLDGWSLLGFLFVLLVALAVGHLTRWYWGVLALVTLVLDHQEPGRPFFVWLSLLASMGLLRVLHAGKLAFLCRLWWWGSVIALIVVVVPFATKQIRVGLYPQVGVRTEDGVIDLYRQDSGDDLLLLSSRPPPQEAVKAGAEDKESARSDVVQEQALTKANEPLARMNAEVAQKLNPPYDTAISEGKMTGRKGGGPGWGEYRQKRALQNDPNAVVQTGPGVPTWVWTVTHLGWSGPVDKGHTLRLWLIPPWANLVLSFLRVLLTLGLGLLLVRFARSSQTPVPSNGPATGGTAAVASAILVLLLLPSLVRADLPDGALLQDLRARLTRPELCQPDCLSTSTLSLSVKDGKMTLAADVSAGTRTVWPLPGPARNWVPASVSVDGKAGPGMVLLNNGFLHVRLDPGHHRIEASGPLPATDTVTLEFADTPHRVETDASGWSVEGLREDGRAERSIQLLRQMQGEVSREFEAASLPPWLQVTRTLDLGIPWLVHTVVRRVSPTGSPILIRVPLLSGESVTESELRMENGQVVVSLGRDDTEIAWESTLTEQPSLSLQAPKGVPWSETWVLRCSPVWSCAMEGISPVRHQTEGRWEPVFQPYPGDTLTLSAVRPTGAKGQSVTIDAAELRVSPGTRLLTGLLTVAVRSSQGGVQTLSLPPDAKVQKLRVDAKDEPIRETGGQIAVSLKPGSQRIEVEWQQPGGMDIGFQVPRVSTGADVTNAKVVVKVPGDRWLLGAGGPSWGPAILFWGFLIACLIGAWILSRSKWSPLKVWQWALLAIGLSQIPVPAALVVVAWFFLLSWRNQRAPNGALAHDFLQIFLVGWTIATLVCLYIAVHTGLLMTPDMQVAGAGSTNDTLIWYSHRVGNELPQPWVFSVPRWVWRGVLLLWSLWLAWSLVRWLPWAWRCFAANRIWIPLIFKPKAPKPEARPQESAEK